MLLHVITFFFFLVFSIYDAQSSGLQSPQFCFDRGSAGVSICGITMEYPLEEPDGQSDSCGYPGLSIGCNTTEYGGTPIINISDHIYRVLDIDYKYHSLRIVDTDVYGQGCPQPKRNFSLPSAPSWVKYRLSENTNFFTIFYNCSSVPDYAEEVLLCPEDYYKKSDTPPSYVFYRRAHSKGYDWYRNCTENVVVPVSFENANFSDAMKSGFYVKWSATDWCADCELSDGQCWSSPFHNLPGCACRNNNSYNRTCWPRPGVSLTPSTNSTSQSHREGMSHRLKIGLGVLAGIGGLLLVAFLLFYGRARHSSLSMFHWRKKIKSLNNMEVLLERYECLSLQRYKYSDIRKMTKSFMDVLGQGGYGQVFKGELRDGRLVAVKVLNESKGNGEDFINELATIGRTNHVNVVNLLGFCIEGTQRALVYEFMPNGSLERFIYTQKESSTTLHLGWAKLYQISLGIARGLEYLHRGCNNRILHFDIKPHNILLDENFCPKISDFGLAKLYPTRESNVSTVGARGTMGYIAPELYCRSFGKASHKSDVYSYGMMMLEMIGGRKNIDVKVDNTSEIYFPLWVYNHLKRNNDIEGLEEIKAREVFDDEKSKKMAMVALWCIQAHPMDRPSMTKVVDMLEGNTQELQMPPNPSVDPRSSTSASS